MCGILFTNKSVENLDWILELAQRRGPDKTSQVEERGFTFIHSLLSITGDFVEQPLTESRGDIFCIYNGQIYNHQDFGDFRSDGQCLIPAYCQYGEYFCRKLDGEFSLILADFKANKLIVSSDTFATKPIWLAIETGDIGVASYESVLKRLGFKKPAKIPANSTSVYNLSTLQLLNSLSVTDFDLRQDQENYEGWISAFQESIRKRSQNLREGIFIGLSSGYDSGAIACELTRQKIEFKAYTIESAENREVLNRRFALLHRGDRIRLTRAEYLAEKTYLYQKAEPFYYEGYSVQGDHGAVGLSKICRLGRAEGYKIYLSGQGADEIISDYGFAGRKFYPDSGFGGLFPKDLASIFPYANFFAGSQIKWINKEEHVAGSHGIETRYPFLDKGCVQAFLRLRPDLKNRRYKAPIAEYLDQNDYPYEDGVKSGFDAHKNLVLHPLSPRYWAKKISRLHRNRADTTSDY